MIFEGPYQFERIQGGPVFERATPFPVFGGRTKTTFQDQTVVFAKIQVGTQRWCLARPLSLADNKRNTVTRPRDVQGAYLVVLKLTGVKLKE